jgi:hypothetical protein
VEAELEPSSAVVVELRSSQRADEGADEDVDVTLKALFRDSVWSDFNDF